MAQKANPFADLMESFQQFTRMSWPGGDMPNMAAASAGGLESMQHVARISTQALQQMMERQQEMAAEAITAWQEAIQEVSAADPDVLMNRVTELSREGAEKAARNFAELSQIAGDARSEIMAVVTGQTKTGQAKSGGDKK